MVDVIVCLNILTEKATDSREIVDYLRNVITNSENYSVNVVGVEMGNEVAGKFHQDVMKFDEFEDYWNYLDGALVTSQTILETISGALSSAGRRSQLFSGILKTVPDSIARLAYAQKALTLNWIWFSFLIRQINQEHVLLMTGTWTCMHTILKPSPEERSENFMLLFCIHTMLKKDWEDDIVIGDTLNPLLDTLYTCPEWDFDEMDDRIQPAFDAARMNFRGFMQNRYMASMDTFNTLLHFNMTSANKKRHVDYRVQL